MDRHKDTIKQTERLLLGQNPGQYNVYSNNCAVQVGNRMSIKVKQLFIVESIFAILGLVIPILFRLLEPNAWTNKVLVKILTCIQLMICPVTLLPLGDQLVHEPRPLLSPWGTTVITNIVIYLLIGGVVYFGKYHVRTALCVLLVLMAVYWGVCIFGMTR